MYNIVERAKQIDEFDNNLPNVEQGGGGGNSLRDLGRYRRCAGGIL